MQKKLVKWMRFDYDDRGRLKRIRVMHTNGVIEVWNHALAAHYVAENMKNMMIEPFIDAYQNKMRGG